ncbi:MAG: hypothetical protein ACOX9A_12710 [Anaerolineae bacterium]|jgi:hypothetical protein
MKARLPQGLLLIAIFQVIPILIVPPDMLASLSPIIWGFIALLFGVLGFNLIRCRAWSRLATVFIQGFNIIVRLLVMIVNVVDGRSAGGPVNYGILVTFIISMLLSTAILYYIDTPDIQIAMR